METTKHSHSKCCRSAATTGKGQWWTCGNWRVIGGVMWDSLCGARKIRMQLQFLTVSKNLNKTKHTAVDPRQQEAQDAGGRAGIGVLLMKK